MSDAHIVNLLTQEGFALLKRKRNETIEECARVVERLDGAETEQLVTAIRALKDKP